jgi:hypothetical protein
VSRREEERRVSHEGAKKKEGAKALRTWRYLESACRFILASRTVDLRPGAVALLFTRKFQQRLDIHIWMLIVQGQRPQCNPILLHDLAEKFPFACRNRRLEWAERSSLYLTPP